MRHRLAVALFLVSAAACGSVPETPTDAPTDAFDTDALPDPCTQSSISVDDFFACLGKEVCRVYNDCLGSDTQHLDCEFLPINVFGNLPPIPLKELIHKDVTSGRVNWNPTAAATCLANLRAQGCSLFKNNSDPFEACGALVGQVGAGQACQNDIECATPGARCIGTGTDTCMMHTCKAPVAAGGSCTSASNNFCVPGDHCVRKNVGGVDMSICASGAANQVCDYDGDCDSGFFCNGGTNNGTAAGICTAAKPVGSICKTDEECSGELVCVGNLGTANGTCRDVRQPGAMCDDTFFSCFGDQYCDQAPNMVGTCKPAPMLNQACGPVNGTASYCGAFMTCEGNICRAPGNIGDPCTSSNLLGIGGSGPNACNLGLFCDKDLTGATVGACKAAQANGSQCHTDNSSVTSGTSRHCASDWCSSGVCTDFPVCSF